MLRSSTRTWGTQNIDLAFDHQREVRHTAGKRCVPVRQGAGRPATRGEVQGHGGARAVRKTDSTPAGGIA